MKIDHLALWVDDLELMRNFYIKYFGATSNEKYTNVKKHYNAYFLSFGDNTTRLEIMHRPDINPTQGQRGLSKGLAHFCITIGSPEKVNTLTERLRSDGYNIHSEPRTTGDGYYESVVLDPEGNYLEISARAFRCFKM